MMQRRHGFLLASDYDTVAILLDFPNGVQHRFSACIVWPSPDNGGSGNGGLGFCDQRVLGSACVEEGVLGDKSTAVVLAALGQAAANPEGQPLHGSKAQPGLFAGTPVGRLAARRCLDEGLLQVLRTETRGKTALDLCAITDKGLAYLLSQVSPRQVLEDFVRALEARDAQAGELLQAVGHMRSTLEGLKASAEKVLHQLGQTEKADRAGPSCNGTRSEETLPGVPAILVALKQWQDSVGSEDLPLPDLCRQAQQVAGPLSIGLFHDGLRQLHEEEHIYLHPWTGPLYAMPEPHFALLIGHEIAYYASLRKG
jgi:hypothetical protein